MKERKTTTQLMVNGFADDFVNTRFFKSYLLMVTKLEQFFIALITSR